MQMLRGFLKTIWPGTHVSSDQIAVSPLSASNAEFARAAQSGYRSVNSLDCEMPMVPSPAVAAGRSLQRDN